MLKRNKLVETDRRKKISLPAALFNKSPMKNSQNNSLLSNDNSISAQVGCCNHPSKKGKYTVVSEQADDEEENFYCEKCAILLASRGFQVQKLQMSSARSIGKTKEPSRDAELKKFMGTIEKKISILHKNEEEMEVVVDNLDSFFEQKGTQAEEYFEYLFQFLQKKKVMYFHNLETKKKRSEDQLQMGLEYVKEKLELLETMREDIISSHDSIVNETPEEDYQLVMTHYRQNIQEIKEEVPEIGDKDGELPSLETVTNALNELMGGVPGTLFSFESQI